MPILFLRLPGEVQMFRSNKTGQLSAAGAVKIYVQIYLQAPAE